MEELRCGAFDVGACKPKLSFTFCTQDTTQVHHISSPPPLYQYMCQVHMFNSIRCTSFHASYMPLEYSKNDLLFLSYFWQRIGGSLFIAPQDDVGSPSDFLCDVYMCLKIYYKVWCDTDTISNCRSKSKLGFAPPRQLPEEVRARPGLNKKMKQCHNLFRSSRNRAYKHSYEGIYKGFPFELTKQQ